jgi:hypothetical protein
MDMEGTSPRKYSNVKLGTLFFGNRPIHRIDFTLNPRNIIQRSNSRGNGLQTRGDVTSSGDEPAAQYD